jgi:hypothetical protein
LVAVVTGILKPVFQHHSDFWKSKEVVTARNAPDQKIWTISYGRVLSDQPIQATVSHDLNSLRTKLRETLTQISAFRQRRGSIISGAINLILPLVYSISLIPLQEMIYFLYLLNTTTHRFFS